jgi:RND family efflux transporter MFP subunit
MTVWTWWLAAALAVDSVHGEPVRVPTWSSEFEAVLRLDDAHAGSEGEATLLVANFATSAPVAEGSARLELHGPSELQAEVKSGSSPGAWPLQLTFPEAGTWAGGITILTPDRADVLGLPEFEVHTELIASDDHDDHGLPWVLLVGTLGVGLLAGGLLGAAQGRRAASQAMSAAAGFAVIGGLGIAARGWAHGGDDHGAAPPPSAQEAGGDLVLGLDSQFLLELRTAQVWRKPFVENVRALGTTVARPGGSADVRAPVAGTVSFAHGHALVPGELVSAGHIIATITEALSGPERSAYAEASAAAKVRLAEARKRLALAERDAARVEALQGTLSERDQLERERGVEAARIEVRQGELAAAALESSLPAITVRAPLTGRLSALLARPGDSVAAGAPLVRVTDGGGLWVEAAVPETWAGRLQIGSPAVLVSDAQRDRPLAGTVLDPGLEADPDSGALRVVLALTEPVEWLVPGMSVTASIAVGEPRDALVVPDAAIVDGAGETLVFVKKAPERFEVRPVRLGALSGEEREVLQGLEPGERVVVQGTYPLRSLAGR